MKHFLILLFSLSMFGCLSDDQKFQTSGVNSKFSFDPKGSIRSYVDYKRDIVQKGRIVKDNQVIDWNAPYFLNPPEHCSDKVKKGVVLIHGLTDSPYGVRALADDLNKNCFTVLSLLLTGHGTRPGDFLEMSYRDWVLEIDYGVQALSEKVDELYLAGHSMGGLLSTYYAATHPDDIDGLMLFAPAISISKKARWASFVKWFKPWLDKYPKENPTKYASFAMNAAEQVYRLTRLLDQALLEEPEALKDMKVFSAFVYEDTTIRSMDSLKQLLLHTSPDLRRILIYHQDNAIMPKELLEKKGVFFKNATLKNKRILGLSHLSFLIRRNDFLYGEKGEYHRHCFYYLGHDQKANYNACKVDPDVWYGEITKANLALGVVSRMMHNPFIDELFNQLRVFFRK